MRPTHLAASQASCGSLARPTFTHASPKIWHRRFAMIFGPTRRADVTVLIMRSESGAMEDNSASGQILTPLHATIWRKLSSNGAVRLSMTVIQPSRRLGHGGNPGNKLGFGAVISRAPKPGLPEKILRPCRRVVPRNGRSPHIKMRSMSPLQSSKTSSSARTT